MEAFTVKLTKPWTPEIFMECYYVVKRKPKRCEKSRPQTATIVSLWFLWFARTSWTLLWLVTTQSTLLKRLRESKWPPNYHSWIFRDLPNISRLLKILRFGHITTKHRSQVSKFHSNFICQFFFSACHGNQSSCSLEYWRISVIKRAMVRRKFIWGGIVKKGNRVVLECSYWLNVYCCLLPNHSYPPPHPPQLKTVWQGLYLA